MNRKIANLHIAALASLLCVGLAACGGSSSPGVNPTTAAADSTGPGATDAKSCAVPYGDAPRPLTDSLDGLLAVTNLCITVGGETLDYTDADGEPRKACAVIPPGATTKTPLPLVVWLHPSLIPIDAIDLTNFLSAKNSADLSGDAARPGFILLMPAGRDTEHFYPFPDNVGLGWDNWYRNLDRSSAQLNVDVETIDHFIDAVKSRGIVDTDRIYMSGWSNGASMALLYALNSPQIAAAAVYSAPAPYSDVDDPCAQSPFASVQTPIYDIHNACDIIGTCQTGSQFHQDLAQRYPKLQQQLVIVDALKNPTPDQSCVAACASSTIIPGEVSLGTLNHLIWPISRNDDMFTFLREHPLQKH
ncbi:MAG: hypothetical protein JWR16_262 [Nevskia sp.]|nr:hypothetical protein [Nevskia sp.]